MNEFQEEIAEAKRIYMKRHPRHVGSFDPDAIAAIIMNEVRPRRAKGPKWVTVYGWEMPKRKKPKNLKNQRRK
jgi:hypothetical protein